MLPIRATPPNSSKRQSTASSSDSQLCKTTMGSPAKGPCRCRDVGSAITTRGAGTGSASRCDGAFRRPGPFQVLLVQRIVFRLRSLQHRGIDQILIGEVAFIKNQIGRAGRGENLRRIGRLAVELIDVYAEVLELGRRHAADRFAQRQGPRAGRSWQPSAAAAGDGPAAARAAARGRRRPRRRPATPAESGRRRAWPTDRAGWARTAPCEQYSAAALVPVPGTAAVPPDRQQFPLETAGFGRIAWGRAAGGSSRRSSPPAGSSSRMTISDRGIVGQNGHRPRLQRLATDQLLHVGLGHGGAVGVRQDHRRAPGGTQVRSEPGRMPHFRPIVRGSGNDHIANPFRSSAAINRCCNARGGRIS